VGFGSMVQVFNEALLVLVPMVLSLTVHECAHARMAKWLGDDTAFLMGRMTLNPLPHIDPIGTVFLPLLTLMASGVVGAGRVPFFGWAKPVPVNAGRFRRSIRVRTGLMWVALAGPVSNLLMALLSALLMGFMAHQGVGMDASAPWYALLEKLFWINIGLCAFNLLPVYPLDGKDVVAGFLSTEAAVRFERFNQQYGTMMLLGLVFFAREILSYPVVFLARGVMAVVGLVF
jgi:Zn-dependent protease